MTSFAITRFSKLGLVFGLLFCWINDVKSLELQERRPLFELAESQSRNSKVTIKDPPSQWKPDLREGSIGLAGLHRCDRESRRVFLRNSHKAARIAFGLSCGVGVSDHKLSKSYALSPEEAATKYDSYATNYDALDGGEASSVLGIDVARTNLIDKTNGDVLEIGVGTGLNLDRYKSRASNSGSNFGITSLTLVDISDGMLQEAKARVARLENLRGVPVKFVRADATSQLVDMFGSRSFDTVVDTFSLCVMGNQGAKLCLNQISQVVKTKDDGGKVLLLENNRSSNPILGIYQDATADVAASAGGKGCLYNQDVANLIRSTNGMEIVESGSYSLGLFRSFECCMQT